MTSAALDVSSVAALARAGFRSPEPSARALERLGAWPPGSGRGAAGMLADLAGSADPDLAAALLADVAAASGGTDLAASLRRHAGARRRLVTLLASSPALGRWLVSHPDEVAPFADGRRFAAPRRPADLSAEALATVARHPDPAGAWDGLRRFKRRELVRIAVRDLRGRASVEEVGAELAALAEACLGAGLVVAGRGLAHVEGVRVAVLGMGKLGGAELNYVSDIDVLFCHEAVAGTDPELATATATRLARELLTGLSAVTPEGACFRVDANLRPEGRDGPLTRTLGSYCAYWDRWAEPWELQALIKVRPVAGDAVLGGAFGDEAARRSYPERLDPATVTAIRRMKARVEASVSGRPGTQVKLGPGGLRDVEFAVQLLQLVHGGRDDSLRSGTTLVALGALARAGLVGREDARRLADAYRFLRTIEHHLQLEHERRTHTIPDDPGRRAWLARMMGYRDGPAGTALEAFEHDYRAHAVTVRSLHEKLFYRPLLEAFGAVPANLDDAQASERLAALGFASPLRAREHLVALTQGLSRHATLMRVMLPVMLPWLAASPDPDGGLAALRALADALGDAAPFLAVLRDNPAAAELLCGILGTSRLLGDLLTRHPELVGGMLDEAALEAPRRPADLSAEALATVARHPDPAGAWDGLRRFKRRELVRIAVRDLRGRASVEEVGAELAALAEACLGAGLVVAGRGLAHVEGVRVAVLGMGKLGGAELNYVSDIDVLFCHEAVAGTDPELATATATRLARELLTGLSAVTPEGACFRVDANLRPEGRDGPLTRTLGSYCAYWDRWAEPWELQALIKVRPVAGDAVLGGAFGDEAARRSYPERLDPATVTAIRRMKARVEAERLPAGVDRGRHLKLGPGGLADVEWTVQLLQLEGGGEDASLRVPSTLAATAALERTGRLGADDARWLSDAWRLAGRLRNRAYLVAGRPVEVLPSDPGLLDRIGRSLGLGGRQRLLEAHRRAARRARRVVDRRFWASPA